MERIFRFQNHSYRPLDQLPGYDYKIHQMTHDREDSSNFKDLREYIPRPDLRKYPDKVNDVNNTFGSIEKKTLLSLAKKQSEMAKLVVVRIYFVIGLG